MALGTNTIRPRGLPPSYYREHQRYRAIQAPLSVTGSTLAIRPVEATTLCVWIHCSSADIGIGTRKCKDNTKHRHKQERISSQYRSTRYGQHRNLGRGLERQIRTDCCIDATLRSRRSQRPMSISLKRAHKGGPPSGRQAQEHKREHPLGCRLRVDLAVESRSSECTVALEERRLLSIVASATQTLQSTAFSY